MENFHQHSDKPTFESVWALFQETDRKFKESREEMRESREQIREAREILEKEIQENEKRMAQQAEENKKLMAQQEKQVNRRINKLEELFTSQWGKLIETLVDGDLVHLLNEYGIEVRSTAQREKGYFNDRQYEFDIIAKNGTDIVVVEVKTTLKVKHVKEFISNLKKFKEILPGYADKNIYGAIAYLQADERAQIYAETQKLFVIRATGNSASIVNSKNFKPKSW
jgi:hypothetical protein